MNLVYLSAHYPAHYGAFIHHLAAHGIHVLGVTDQSDEQLRPELRHNLTGHYKVDSFTNTDQVMEACSYFSERFGPIDRVESHLESWIELEAEIRDRFNVTGKKMADLGHIKRKSLMKEMFTRAGVPTARGVVVESFEQCKSFINGTYPAFIKPDIGVGAGDTHTIRSEDDLRHFFAIKSTYDYFLEEYLTGTIESFNRLTDAQGNVVFYTSHVFSNDIHKVVAHNENLYYYSQREIPEDIRAYGHSLIKVLDLREKFFHIEFFRAADGVLKGLEVNMRPPGGQSTHMFNFACDIDVYAWWAAIMAGKAANGTYERKYHCAFIARKYDREYVLSHNEIFARFPHQIVHHQDMNPIEYAVMGQHSYLARSASRDEILEICNLVTKSR